MILLGHENIQKIFPAKDSPVGSVGAINGRGHHIWVTGDTGLAFFDGNHFRRVVPADAETFGSVAGVEETSNGSLWLGRGGNIAEIQATEIRRFLGDPSYRVKYRVFNSFDGFPGIYEKV